ncbi:AraC family transcriptional regulator [Neorhizobium galegae]|uniref:helix-turn-helix domain-containing protein n=1 Tax=Neorhizobium galegae TaxID=399 RepID=UPI002101001C|nr:AraC family transcriptional regulator [Neorhizobium galegae]MCQ1574637.1 AraC family transcriptional regulator [Neorhizobium galegae]
MGSNHLQLQFDRQLGECLSPQERGRANVSRDGLSSAQREAIEAYIRDRLAEKIRVLDLARSVRLCASHFSRAFRVSYGCSPYAYLVNRRMALACHLMVSTDEPLSQIAVTCGLTDQSHLSNVFRKRLGTSPLAWQRARLSRLAGSDKAGESLAAG